MMDRVLYFAAWYVAGFSGHVFLVLQTEDFTVADFPVAILAGITGPLPWIIAGLHSLDDCTQKLLRKRKK
jgi:hypothetical protein